MRQMVGEDVRNEMVHRRGWRTCGEHKADGGERVVSGRRNEGREEDEVKELEWE